MKIVEKSGDQRKEGFESNSRDALDMHKHNMEDKENKALYELRKKIFLEAVEFQKRVEEMCFAAGFYPENAAVKIERVDDVGDRYGFDMTVESGVELECLLGERHG